MEKGSIRPVVRSVWANNSVFEVTQSGACFTLVVSYVIMAV